MKNWMRSAALLMTLAWAGLAGCGQQAGAYIDVQQAAEIQKQGGLLLDVREPVEYEEVHAPNSTLLPLNQIPGRVADIQAYKDKPVAVICRSGNRSERALYMLQKAGFTKAASVNGGMIAWEQAGLPVESGKQQENYWK